MSKNQLLKETGNGFVLKKPLTIIISKSVIDILNSIYIANGERGGLMWLESTGDNTAQIKRVSVLQNTSGDNTKFEPTEKEMQETINLITSSGCLPIVFHTHPTNLGIPLYDNKKENFYLRASQPDRVFAQNLLDGTTLYMPEMIFVKDERFENGYGLALYGGKILPNGFSRLSALQFCILAALGYIWVKKGVTGTTLAFAVGLLLLEESKRPKYNTENGNYIISF